MWSYVGTSGWIYQWNEGNSLDWYVAESGLNAVELNSSFYRFPSPNQVKAWASKGKSLAWSIKVNQLITHRFKLNRNSYDAFSRFLRLFHPLESNIKFYLFQFPPILTPNSIENIEKFANKFPLQEKFALEVRNIKWFNPEVYKRIKTLGLTMVSIDAPIGTFLMKTSHYVYIRFHGRGSWYSHRYSANELSETLTSVQKLKPHSLFAFFNNDHDMLENSRQFLSYSLSRKRKLKYMN